MALVIHSDLYIIPLHSCPLVIQLPSSSIHLLLPCLSLIFIHYSSLFISLFTDPNPSFACSFSVFPLMFIHYFLLFTSVFTITLYSLPLFILSLSPLYPFTSLFIAALYHSFIHCLSLSSLHPSTSLSIASTHVPLPSLTSRHSTRRPLTPHKNG